ncbi:MAG: response regulator [Acidobacteria bacterium]|nr:response regulator [Acidobacteriota bacterium]
MNTQTSAAWPATPLSHLWKVSGAFLAAALAVATTVWPSPLRLDLTLLTAAATVGALPAVAAAIAHAAVTLVRDHSGAAAVDILVGLVTAIAAAAVLRRSPRRAALPSRAAARLLPLIPLAIAAGVAHSELVQRGEPLAAQHLLLSPIKALAALLLAAAIIRGPRRGREAGPVFLSAAVAFIATSIIIATVAMWERQDESLLHSTADATKLAFMDAIGKEMTTVDGKAQSSATEPITAERFAESVRSTVYSNQAIAGMQLLDLAPDGTVTVQAQLSTQGLDFEAGAAEWLQQSGVALDKAVRNGVVSYIGLARLPHPTLGSAPVLVYASPLRDAPGRSVSAHDRILSAAFSVPVMLSSASVPTIAFTSEATVSLYLKLDGGQALPIWSTHGSIDGGGLTQSNGFAPEPAPQDLTGVTALSEFDLSDYAIIFAAEPGVDFGTPSDFRRLVLLLEAVLAAFLIAMVLVNGDHRARREKERLRREALLASALEGSAGWTCIIDPHDRVVMSNSDPHSLPPGAPISSSSLWSEHPEQANAVNDLIHAARLGTPGSLQHVWSDGSDPANAIRIFDIDARPLPDPSLVYLQVVDVTESRDRAMRTAQSERMEAIGVLAGGLAHDFNNLLFITLGYLQMLERQPKINGDPQANSYVGRAIEAVERGATVAKSLLSLARSQPLASVPVNIRQFLDDIRPLIEQALGTAHQLQIDVVDDDLDVMVDRGRLSSGLLNLVFNARDAMEGRGRLEIRAEHCVAAPVGGEAMPAIALSVRDTGKGMSPEVLARAFEPFFTTKQVGSGTGLGLSTLYSFAQQSGGWATIESAEGVGTTVTVFLPPVIVPSPGVDVPLPPSRSATRALVVDDERALADLVAGWLEDLGMDTRVAHDPDEAIRLAEEFHPELLVSDANLGAEIDGLELARRMVELEPSLLVVFMTGFSERIKALQAAGVATLAKPFSRDDLAANLRSHLGDRLPDSSKGQP